ncbi:MAG TPA: bifunctional phosphopantothenoylcysteine decarboxylase/phosphopantothenate--cysteine ligase CoaBC [Thermoanaerobaculia bacterium]|nr:bifunctional phosphopantothenoylcysteine decarboxylase/phosphopantothenate--cysteine ligase CoaBC [Thermoanaerobaculia bacterium]
MKIVLGVSGGIAAYKAPDLVRRLQDIGADVRVILTPNAARFVSPLSLSAVSNHGVIQDHWGDASQGGVDHIEVARWADLLLIAPATANVIAKLAVGIADDALTTYAVAHRTAILVAPAMNTFMLANAAVQDNLQRLRTRGVEIMEPDSGLLACGDEGAGRLPDIPVIVERVRQMFAAKDLTGKRILVTAGPTREALDPVRYLSNRSSGKMGYAIAGAARARGAEVTLVTGPTSITVPAGVAVLQVTSAQEMSDAVMSALPGQHVVIKAAAVADFTAASVADQKIKKSPDSETLELTLKKTPDILGSIRKVNGGPYVVAFAAETENVESNAQEKLESKGADLIVANDVSDSAIGFDSDENEVTVISRQGTTVRLPRASKAVIANQILDIVVKQI